jgi:type VI secretion system protein ImpC
MERHDCEDWLNNWIANYVCADDKPDAGTKARYPLAEAKIEVREIPGKPGEYNAVAFLRPWLQFEALTASMRLVAKIPKKQG